MRLLRHLLNTFTALLVVISATTYFTSLSQYATEDQGLTLGRIHHFLKTGESPFLDNAKITVVFVGIPGVLFKKGLDLFYSFQDTIFPGLIYTPFLPYAFFSSLWSLVLCFYSVFLIARIYRLERKKHFLLLGVILLLLLNIPILKATSKILKYDSLAIWLSLVSLLQYRLWVQEKRKRQNYFWILFSALAFYEKMTSLLCFFALLVMESFRYSCEERSHLALAKRIGRLAVLSVGIFLGTAVILMPKFIVTPSEWHALVIGPFEHASVNPVALPILFVVAAALICVRNWAHKGIEKSRRYVPFLAGLSFLLAVLYSVFFQSNQIYVFEYLPNAVRESIKEQGLYTGPKILYTQLTTLDSSAFVTRAKIFLTWIRLTVYTLPLGCLFLLAGMFLKSATKRYLPEVYLTILIWGAFFAALCFPLEARYNSMVIVLMVLLSIATLISLYEGLERRKFTQVLLLCLVIVFQLPLLFWNHPTYFGYLNSLRSRTHENADTFALGHLMWTGPGWGEHSYEITNFLEKQIGRPAKLGIDYVAPFALPKATQLKMVNYYEDAGLSLEKWIEKLVEQDQIEYLMVSRNMTFRNERANQLLRKYSEKAIFSSEVTGVTYAWLLPLRDLTRNP